jgi:hypothetical protein
MLHRPPVEQARLIHLYEKTKKDSPKHSILLVATQTRCTRVMAFNSKSNHWSCSKLTTQTISPEPHPSPTGRAPFTPSNQPRRPHARTARSATRARPSPHAEAAAFPILSYNYPDEAPCASRRLGLQSPFEGGRPAEAELVAASTARSPGGGSNGSTGCLLSLERRGGLGASAGHAWTVP